MAAMRIGLIVFLIGVLSGQAFADEAVANNDGPGGLTEAALSAAGVFEFESAVDNPTINAGMNDAWVSDDAPFQGFFFTVFEDISLFFLSWFTFDSVPPSSGSAVFGAIDQRWVTASGTFTGNMVTLSVELTTGGVFNSSDPMATQTQNYGTITIVFNNCNEAVLTYNFPGPGLSGMMTLTRVVDDNVELCDMLATP